MVDQAEIGNYLGLGLVIMYFFEQTYFFHKNILYFLHIISSHWYGAASWNWSSRKTTTCLSNRVNSTAAEDLGSQVISSHSIDLVLSEYYSLGNRRVNEYNIKSKRKYNKIISAIANIQTMANKILSNQNAIPCIREHKIHPGINGLMQKRCNSGVLELHPFCIKPLSHRMASKSARPCFYQARWVWSID